MASDTLFHPDFKTLPYWWEAAAPTLEGSSDLPARTSVAIIGSGYAGLSAALELARSGVEATVLEAAEFGSGASSRNGGAVSGGSSLGKGFSGSKSKRIEQEGFIRAGLHDAAESFGLVETLIEREGIACHYQRSGRFVGAFVPAHYDSLTQQAEMLNEMADAGASMLPRERQREEIASDYYHGGMVVERSGKLHPALYHRGLLEACRRAGVRLCAQTRVERIEGKAGSFRLTTGRGTLAAEQLIVATNGYTGAVTPWLRRRLVPVASHIIATEELPPDLAASLAPKGRTLADTRRVLCYYRMSPDGRRMIFGGRARFTQASPEVSAPVLHQFMTERFPQLKGYRVTHAWTGNVAFAFDFVPHMGQEEGKHYCLACNGSGIAMMTYLGYRTAQKIVGSNRTACAFDQPDFPTVPFYRGNPWFLPLVGSYYRRQDRKDRAAADKG